MTHFLQRTSLIALAAGALGACSTYPAEPLRPNFPVRSAEEAPPAPTQAPAQPPAAEEAPLPQTRAPAPVESRPLDTLPPASSTPAVQPTAPAAQPRPAPSQPTYRTVTTRSVTGRVLDVDGEAETYTVKSGDNLEKIAKKLGTTVEQLREDNDLGRRATIHPGDELKGPVSKAKAYVVGQGDTLFAIARRFGVTADTIAEENKIGRNSALRVGQRLRLPDGFKDKGPIVTTSRVQVEGVSAPEVDVAPPPSVRTTAPARTQTARGETPPATAAQEFRTTTRRSVTGRVVDVEGPRATYTVKKGDNLEKIARSLETTVEQLRKDNKIKGSNIQPGDDLKGPATEAKAYVTVPGDTLAGVARRFSVTEAALRSSNDLSRGAAIRSGQRLRLPSGYRDRGPLTETIRTPVERPAAPPPQPVRTEPPRPAVTTPEPSAALPTTPQPYTPSPGVRPPAPTSGRPPTAQPSTSSPAPAAARPPTPPAQSTARPYTPPPASTARPTSPSTGPVAGPSSSGPVSDAQISELGRGRFVWPLQGAIVSDFGPKGAGQRNDGINIGAEAGAPVRAAAPGTVVYAGDQVPGFGNLVLIKHEDGWVTAYGHLSRVGVKMQQQVTQGQQIGAAGSSGGVPEPQLHFEVRYAPAPTERARPIDPKLVLPR